MRALTGHTVFGLKFHDAPPFIPINYSGYGPSSFRGYQSWLFIENIRDDMAKGKTWLKDSHILRGGSTVKGGKIDRYELNDDGKNIWDGFEGKIVYDYRTNSLFRKQGNYFILVEDINKE